MDNNCRYNAFYNSEIIPVQPVTIITISKGGGIDSVILGGLSAIGEERRLCPVVTIVGIDGYNHWGWSLCLNHPGEKRGDLHYFDSSDKNTFRGSEFPNFLRCFIAKVEFPLTSINASLEEIDEILAFVLPQIKTVDKIWDSFANPKMN